MVAAPIVLRSHDLAETCNILLSSAGRRVALLRLCRSELRDLNMSGRLIATDMSPWSAAFHDADQGMVVRRCTDDAFGPEMLDLCRQWDIRLVIPTIDTELPAWSAIRSAAEEAGTTVLVPDARVVAIARDKRQTHRWLRDCSLPTVDQWEVDEALELPADRYPLFVKPAAGSGSSGAGLAHDRNQLQAMTRAGGFIVQSPARGIEYSLDIFHDLEGRCRGLTARRRIETRAGEISKGVIEDIGCLRELGDRVMASLEPYVQDHRVSDRGAQPVADSLSLLRGVVNVQVFYDAARKSMEIIEMNARFPGGYPLTHAGGAAYLRWLLMQAVGRPLPDPLPTARAGTAMLRFDEAVFTDLGAIEGAKQ